MNAPIVNLSALVRIAQCSLPPGILGKDGAWDVGRGAGIVLGGHRLMQAWSRLRVDLQHFFWRDFLFMIMKVKYIILLRHMDIVSSQCYILVRHSDA